MLEKDKKYIKDIIQSVLKSERKMYGGNVDKIIRDILNKNGRKIMEYKQNGGSVEKIIRDILNKNGRKIIEYKQKGGSCSYHKKGGSTKQCGGITQSGRRCMNSCRIGNYCYLHCY
jgi:hypothetical protein